MHRNGASRSVREPVTTVPVAITGVISAISLSEIAIKQASPEHLITRASLYGSRSTT